MIGMALVFVLLVSLAVSSCMRYSVIVIFPAKITVSECHLKTLTL